MSQWDFGAEGQNGMVIVQERIYALFKEIVRNSTQRHITNRLTNINSDGIRALTVGKCVGSAVNTLGAHNFYWPTMSLCRNTSRTIHNSRFSPRGVLYATSELVWISERSEKEERSADLLQKK